MRRLSDKFIGKFSTQIVQLVINSKNQKHLDAMDCQSGDLGLVKMIQLMLAKTLLNTLVMDGMKTVSPVLYFKFFEFELRIHKLK